MNLKLFQQFVPPGPVAGAFLSDRTSKVKVLRGPVGGGKTVTCIFDGLRAACEMPECRDGVIRFRDAIIGTTYGQLERNLYPTWQKWLPPDGKMDDGGMWTEAEFSGGGGRYAKHVMSWDVLRGNRRVQVIYEAIFSAIGEQAVEQFMRGFEPTRFWLFEIDLAPEAALDIALTRLGRFPARPDIANDAPFHSYVVGDLNAPDVDSWFYTRFEEKRPDSWRHYVQPSALSPRAENLKNLQPDYYDNQLSALSAKPNLIKRFVKNEYAPSASGKPVYDEYSDERHLAPGPIAAVKGHPILLGVDAGLRAPAAVILQIIRGQCRVLGEVVPGRTGPRTFAELIRREVVEVAPGCRVSSGYCDPAGFTGGVSEEDLLPWAETLMHELKIPIEPTWTNAIDVRHDAVRDELKATIDGSMPALFISSRCKSLRKGFASHYRYPLRRQASSETLGSKPEKNEWSHVHDALQYALLGLKGQYGTTTNQRPGDSAPAGGTHSLKNTTKLFG